MQSDGNSFDGDIVLDSFNKACTGEDSILDQMYEKEIYLDFDNEYKIFRIYHENACLCIWVPVEYCINLDIHYLKSILNFNVFIIQIRKYLLLYVWSKMLYLCLHAMLTLFKTKSATKLFPSDCITDFPYITNM